MKTIFRSASLLIFFILIFFSTRTQAQWVTIPDANFATYLQQHFPGCMNGNLMDTTCSAIVTKDSLNLEWVNAQTLDGIQYFDSLDSLSIISNIYLTSIPSLPPAVTYLVCKSTNITTLPDLPVGLTYLDCSNNDLTGLPSLPLGLTHFYCPKNQLSSIPALPAGLLDFSCSDNQIISLPTLPSTLLEFNCSINQILSLPQLPGLLKHIYCYTNQLTSLPPLPAFLKELLCGENQLTSLPALTSPSMIILECSYNSLTSLPALPPNLVSLDCSHNQLTGLPVLNDTLAFLYCNNNLLTNLPALPTIIFYDLDCSHNQLTSLPIFPPTLTNLHCGYNQITNILPLPYNLHQFACQNNQLSCLPVIPSTIANYPSAINVSNNPLTCLPNYVFAMDSATKAIPLCVDNDLINNPNACPGIKGVQGYTYKDVNSNCISDAGDAPVTNIPVQLFDNSGSLMAVFYSLDNGVYNYILNSGNYVVAIDTAYRSFDINCSYPGIDSAFALTTGSPLAKNINFNIACKPGFDVGVKSVIPSGIIFPGLPHRINIAAGDLSRWYNLNCASGISGTVVITLTGPVTFDSIPSGALLPSGINGNVFTYSISDFGVFDLNSFMMWVTMDSLAQVNDPICIHVDVTPVAGDYNNSNNDYTFCYPVVNSQDPNEKHVYPTTVSPFYNGYFTYTVNFQNVGTAAAQNIRVVDTIANNLDLSTFEIINYSHANTSTLTGNEAIFRFPNIQLADSTSNPEGSKGFIQYRVKPIANLPLGTQIENKADIYFDFNAPITTNTAVSNFNSTVSLTPNPSFQESGVMVYPNPGKGVFNLRFSDNNSSIKTIEVFSLIGEKIFSGSTKAVSSVVDLRIHSNGVYVLRVSDDNNVYTQRIVKQ